MTMNSPSRTLAFDDVVVLADEERQYQDRKHGKIEQHGHTVGGWILLMESELAEAKLALIKGGTGRDSVMHEILQIVATGMAAIEQHGMSETAGNL